MVLITFMVFCSLLLTAAEEASAIPYTITWDVNGSMNGENLGTSDQSSWSAQFFIESSDHSWSDTWGQSGIIQNASGNVAHNIDFFNAVTYDLDGGETYHVDWRIRVDAHFKNSLGRFEWEIDAQMDRMGPALWLDGENTVSGLVRDSTGTDSYLNVHTDFAPVTDFAGYGNMTAESAATTDRLSVKGDVSINPDMYSAEGYSESEFSGRLQVVPDVMPAPGGLMLVSLGIGIVGWLRGRRTL
jgi:hypothetical protein